MYGGGNEVAPEDYGLVPRREEGYAYRGGW